MPAYFVLLIQIQDHSAYAEYARLAPATSAPYGGRAIVRGPVHEVLEGNVDVQPGTRLVILEFESIEPTRSWWTSSEYRKVISLREPPVAQPIVGLLIDAAIADQTSGPARSRRGDCRTQRVRSQAPARSHDLLRSRATR